MLQDVHVARGNDMMGFIDEDELEPLGIELLDPVLGADASHGGDSDICQTGRMKAAHLQIYLLGRVDVEAMPSGLLDQLPTVSQDERL